QFTIVRQVETSADIRAAHLCVSTIHDLVTKFETTGSVQNKKHAKAYARVRSRT
ncbi:hypothetical protein L9F63_022400, partial [Diploptera punctata]